MGPVTVPSAYTYSQAPAAGGPFILGQYFYLGDAADKYTWQQYYPQFSESAAPQLWAPTPTLGANAITIAPIYVYVPSQGESSLDHVITSGGPGGNDHYVQAYDSLFNTWAPLYTSTGSELAVPGIAADGTNGDFWGWTHFTSSSGGAVYTNDPASGAYTLQSGWPGLSSIAPSITDVHPRDDIEYLCWSPRRQMHRFGQRAREPLDAPRRDNYGAAQVTADTINGQKYALDTSGRVGFSTELVG